MEQLHVGPFFFQQSKKVTELSDVSRHDYTVEFPRYSSALSICYGKVCQAQHFSFSQVHSVAKFLVIRLWVTTLGVLPLHFLEYPKHVPVHRYVHNPSTTQTLAP